jgi:hypothetical protein
MFKSLLNEKILGGILGGTDVKKGDCLMLNELLV